jgi:uncharacterized protein (DUF58 family)
VQLVNPSRIWVALLIGLGVVLAVAYVWARQLQGFLSASRQVVGTWVLVGDVLVERFTIQNASSLPALWVEIIDHSDLPGYQPGWVATVDAGNQQRREVTGRCQRRGVFTLGPWELRTGDPLGLFTVVHEYNETRSILVYPRAMRLPELNLPRGTAPGPARTSRRTPQFTTAVASVRPYTPGDELRRIHWRRTAHHDALMVKEFDLEPSGDLWVVLDLNASVHVGEGATSTLEYGITLAASLATQMLGENRRVGLAAFGRQAALIPPQAGQLQVWRILEALAHAEPESDLPLDRVLRDVRNTLGRGRTLVVITPATDPAWSAELLHLAHVGNAPAVLLLDAASFAVGDGATAADDPRKAALAGLCGLLADQGIATHVIDRSFVFQPLVRISRRRKELRTLYGTGRVIAVEVEELV